MIGKTQLYLNSVNCKILLGLLLLLLATLAISFISINLSILVFFGFLPTLVAIAVDNYKKRVLSRIVGLFNILGSLNFFIQILSNTQEIQRISYMIISIPHTWLVIYSSCAFGWGLYLFIPRIVYYFIYAKKTDLLYKLREVLNSIY